MKLTALVCLLVILSGISSCKKEENKADDADPTKNSISFYKNTSGDPAFNGLHAQIENTQYNWKFNLYGTFDNTNRPDKLTSMSFVRSGNDTIVYMLFDTISNKLETIYTEVAGIKQPYVLKNEYLANNDTSLIMSVYNYNWANNTAVLKFQTLVNQSNHIPTYANRWYSPADYLQGLAAGVTVAGLVYTVANAAAIGAAIAAAGPAILAAAIATGAIIAVLSVILPNSAMAAEPQSGPFPANTPILNPAYNPTPNLPVSPCQSQGIYITFTANRDASNNILVSGAYGGTAPYTYAVGNLNFQSSQVFSPALSSSYLIFVKDANGCIGGRLVNIAEEEGTFYDTRDGQSYPYKQIGSQVWMTKNFNYTIQGSMCYDSVTANCDLFGKLYTPAAAVAATPPGWHLPSEAEYNTLINYLDPNWAGIRLKSSVRWYHPSNNITPGNNQSGFNAYGSGYATFYDNGTSIVYTSTAISKEAYFATATSNLFMSLFYINPTAGWNSGSDVLSSVRYIRN